MTQEEIRWSVFGQVYRCRVGPAGGYDSDGKFETEENVPIVRVPGVGEVPLARTRSQAVKVGEWLIACAERMSHPVDDEHPTTD